MSDRETAGIDRSWRERRTDDRFDTDIAATIRAYRLGPFDTRLVDISNGGALLALGVDSVRRGDEVILVAAGIELVATVAWATDDYCGVAFHRRLTPAEIAKWRRADRARR